MGELAVCVEVPQQQENELSPQASVLSENQSESGDFSGCFVCPRDSDNGRPRYVISNPHCPGPLSGSSDVRGPPLFRNPRKSGRGDLMLYKARWCCSSTETASVCE